jgi:hypothetical protein
VKKSNAAIACRWLCRKVNDCIAFSGYSRGRSRRRKRDTLGRRPRSRVGATRRGSGARPSAGFGDSFVEPTNRLQPSNQGRQLFRRNALAREAESLRDAKKRPSQATPR